MHDDEVSFLCLLVFNQVKHVPRYTKTFHPQKYLISKRSF